MTSGRFFIEGKRERTGTVSSIDLWSTFATLTITTVAATQALPSITIAGLPIGVMLVRVVAIVKFRVISEHISADADLQDDQQVQVRKATDGSWLTGLTLLDGQLICPADAREFGDVFIGNIDVKEQIPDNGEVVEIQWVNSRVSAGEVHLEDLQTGLRIWFTI